MLACHAGDTGSNPVGSAIFVSPGYVCKRSTQGDCKSSVLSDFVGSSPYRNHHSLVEVFMSETAAQQYRKVMAEDLHIDPKGRVVLRKTARLNALEDAWDQMNHVERREANAYVKRLAQGEVTLEQFVKETLG